jgi:phthiocerol/phenolphthiocerol synthesis type-I polyketide synthase C
MNRSLHSSEDFERHDAPVDLLVQRLASRPNAPAFSFLRTDLGIDNQLSGGVLDNEARAFAARLQQLGFSRQRAILLYPPGREFIVAFVGCLYAGVVAVPVIPPRSTRSTDRLKRLAVIAKDAQPAVVLATPRLKQLLAQIDAGGSPAVPRDVPIVDSVTGAESDWTRPDISGDDLAMLQYTSGSTGSPKGVMVSHRNLVANAASMCRALRMTEPWTFVSWLPPYHDMGLIGTLLLPLFSGGHCHVLSPTAFFQRPIVWLEAVAKYEADISGAPNFAYDLCVDRIPTSKVPSLNLSRWRVAFNGSEPIRTNTMELFAKHFSASGFSADAFFPCYGLAEATLFVSGSRSDEPVPTAIAESEHCDPDDDAVAASGKRDPGQRIEIVDPVTCRRTPDGELGEIWVAGPNIAHGYWRRPERTKLTFGARLADRDELFLRTGDLGFVRGDRLFVKGRLKDLVIIRGRNHDPADIERSVGAAHPDLGAGSSVAFSIVDGREEQLVILHELARRESSAATIDPLFGAIRRAVAEKHGLEVGAIAIIRSGGLPRTLTGKLQRRGYRAAFLRGELPVVSEWRPSRRSRAARGEAPLTQRSIEDWLLARLVARLGVPSAVISAHDPIAAYDLDSSDAVALSLDLETWLDIHVSPTLFFEHPTIADLARFVTREALTPHPNTTATHALPRVPPKETSMSDVEARLARLSPAKRALAALQARSGLESSGRMEPIAVIGMACRYPGANSPAAFWDLLRGGVDAITEIPADRWDVERFYDPDPDAPGRMYSRWGGFIPDVDKFDAKFFGISPREAMRMDPQQRLLLEVAWEALEHAGQVPEQLAGGRHGVFVGISNEEYSSRFKQDDPTLIDPYTGTGVAISVAAGRLSYLLRFRGPTMSVDTACSSSLVSVALACQSLQLKESQLALAGGVNLILSPRGAIYFCKVRVLADDGHCKTFDARANGYVRGEGCGFVVLKRLSDAVAARDHILAVIRGTAVNHDGQSGGLTVPSGAAQQDVIRDALVRAAIKPAEVGYLEAHGTGTAIGDPIEVRALGHVLGEGRAPGHPLYLGSVKTNIGHLESAAGIAGLMKIILAVQHAEIPPHLNFAQPSPHIDLESFHGRVPVTLTPWPNGGRRVAGVSSFGLSGTNAHVVVEAYTPQAAGERDQQVSPDSQAAVERLLVPLSARSPQSLSELASRYADWIAGRPDADISLADFAHTAGVRRSHHAHRAAISTTSRDDLVDKLRGVAAGTPAPGVVVGRVSPSRLRKAVFIFSGQGSQWIGMGRDLIDRQPEFRTALSACDAAIRSEAGFSVVDRLMGRDPSTPEEIDTIQPTLFALQVAIAALWKTWGIAPQGVIGHSMGEVAAAHVAGALTLEDAVAIICRRSRLLKRTSGKGAMAMVDLSLDDATRAIERSADRVAVAVNNSPRSSVLSGDPEAIDELLATLEADGVFCRRVKVDVASHSPQMDALTDDLLRELQEIRSTEPLTPMYSTVTGNAVTAQMLTADYWMRNLRRPVLFSQTLQKMIGNGYDMFVEISPHPILLPAVEEILRHIGREGTSVASMRRETDACSTFHDAIATLYANGANPDWKALAPAHARFIPIPTYPWQSERYWVPDELQLSWSRARQDEHPFLAECWTSSLHGDRTWETTLSTTAFPFLKDHQVAGEVVLPAVIYLETALAAGRRVLGDNAIRLEDVVFKRMLMMGDDEARVLQIVVSAESNSSATFAISSRAKTDADAGHDAWQLHATGTVRSEGAGDEERPTLLPELQQRIGTEIDREVFYQELEKRGLIYGPAFRGVARIWVGQGESLGALRITESYAYRSRAFHANPTVLDAALQLVAASLASSGEGSDERVRYLPVGVERLRRYGPIPSECWAHACVSEAIGANGMRTADVRLLDADGRLVLEIGGVRVQRLESQGRATAELAHNLYRIEWKPAPAAPADAPDDGSAAGAWLVFENPAGAATRLVQSLERRGARCAVVSPGDAFGRHGDNRFTIRPTSIEDYRQLLRDGLPDAGSTIPRIVHSWSVAAGDDDRISGEAMRAAHAQGVVSVMKLVQALADAKWVEYPRLWLVTRGAEAIDGSVDPSGLLQSPLRGFAKSLAIEHPELRCSRVDLDPALSADDQIAALVAELCGDEREDQIAFRNGARLVARLRRVSPDFGARRKFVAAGTRPFRATVPAAGTLDAVNFAELTRRTPAAGEVEIDVRAAGLNFSDVMKVLGIYPGVEQGLMPIGAECSGTISAAGEDTGFQIGQPVFAFAPFSFASHALSPAPLVFAKPDAMSFAEAATLPAAFLTAHYALVELGHLSAGETVLIHSASGGVGLAAVQIARRIGAEVLATAGNAAKRDYLRSLGIACVMDSRSTAFADEVMEHTRHRGVDVVLNSLPGEAIPKGVSVLAPFGRFLELGKRDIYENRQIGLMPFRNNISFSAIDLEKVFREKPLLVVRMMAELVPLFESGELTPLPHHLFAMGSLPDAFRFMAQAKHIGKIVVSRDRSERPAAEPERVLRICEDRTYLVTGGLGALGLKVAEWLVGQGARNIALLGRSAAQPAPATTAVLDSLRASPARVNLYGTDVSDPEALAAALAKIREELPPLAGIVHAAGTLVDGLVVSLDEAKCDAVMKPKIDGSWNLHSLTLHDPLDFFVLFSSAASVLGSPGQANYAAGNAFLDALAHYRRGQGLPAASINWSHWGQAGLAAMPERGGRLATQGVRAIEPTEGIDAFELLLNQDAAQICVLPIDFAAWLEKNPRGIELPVLGDLVQTGQPSAAALESPVKAQLKALPPGRARRALLESHLQQQIAQVLRLPESEIDVEAPLQTMGFDSLMALELRNRLEASLGVTLSATMAWNFPTIVALAGHLGERMRLPLDAPIDRAAPQEDVKSGSTKAGDAELATMLQQLRDVPPGGTVDASGTPEAALSVADAPGSPFAAS